VAIQIGPRKGEPPIALHEVAAFAGKGLEGDRFFKKRGTYRSKLGKGLEITLIEEEALAAVEREHALGVSFADTRRNVLVRGVALNDLVGRDFLLGDVLLRGARLCEPCRRLSALCKKPVVRALAHRGGLNARILVDGVIRVGSEIVVVHAVVSADRGR
jgi:MOSC domain-containing protein YiiM